VLLDDRIGRVRDAMRIARRTMHIARQSIVVGLGLSGLAMIVAAFGALPPVAGAALQEAIDIAVILNALRTARDVPASDPGREVPRAGRAAPRAERSVGRVGESRTHVG
jgi:cation transport ATPase